MKGSPLQEKQEITVSGKLSPEPAEGAGRWTRSLELFAVSLKLGLTSFGGPVAHLGYFRSEYVTRRGWLDERSYAELVALCQFLPGPASSQTGIGIGLLRGGLLGGFAAWLGFTLPSALALALFAYAVQGASLASAGWLHGLKLVAVAIVAQAVLGMGRTLAPDRSRAAVALLAAAVTLLWPAAYSQVLVIAAAGLFGYRAYRGHPEPPDGGTALQTAFLPGRRLAAACLALFTLLLVALPLLRSGTGSPAVALFDSMYRAGSLVFGGGHVVLPLLQQEVVPAGWVSPEAFVAGYGAAQAVPGPLFTFASYLGASSFGLPGAVLATVAIFLPAFLLVAGTLPFWGWLRSRPGAQAALAGVNAAVVGILLAAWYHPIWTGAVLRPADFAAAALLFGLLVFWKLPPWAVVLLGICAGIGLQWV